MWGATGRRPRDAHVFWSREGRPVFFSRRRHRDRDTEFRRSACGEAGRRRPDRRTGSGRQAAVVARAKRARQRQNAATATAGGREAIYCREKHGRDNLARNGGIARRTASPNLASGRERMARKVASGYFVETDGLRGEQPPQTSRADGSGWRGR
jgi:hypothetical protein